MSALNLYSCTDLHIAHGAGDCCTLATWCPVAADYVLGVSVCLLFVTDFCKKNYFKKNL